MEAIAGSGSGLDAVPGGVGLLPQEHCNKDQKPILMFLFYFKSQLQNSKMFSILLKLSVVHAFTINSGTK